MGRARGVSAGGGQSSLGYLFGSSEDTPKPSVAAAAAEKPETAEKATMPPSPVDKAKQAPAGIQGGGSTTNNYFRSEGQNCGNFLTDRPSTKVHAAPGGGSSLGYLFGGESK